MVDIIKTYEVDLDVVRRTLGNRPGAQGLAQFNVVTGHSGNWPKPAAIETTTFLLGDDGGIIKETRKATLESGGCPPGTYPDPDKLKAYQQGGRRIPCFDSSNGAFSRFATLEGSFWGRMEKWINTLAQWQFMQPIPFCQGCGPNDVIDHSATFILRLAFEIRYGVKVDDYQRAWFEMNSRIKDHSQWFRDVAANRYSLSEAEFFARPPYKNGTVRHETPRPIGANPPTSPLPAPSPSPSPTPTPPVLDDVLGDGSTQRKLLPQSISVFGRQFATTPVLFALGGLTLAGLIAVSRRQ